MIQKMSLFYWTCWYLTFPLDKVIFRSYNLFIHSDMYDIEISDDKDMIPIRCYAERSTDGASAFDALVYYRLGADCRNQRMAVRSFRYRA